MDSIEFLDQLAARVIDHVVTQNAPREVDIELDAVVTILNDGLHEFQEADREAIHKAYRTSEVGELLERLKAWGMIDNEGQLRDVPAELRAQGGG